MEVEMALLLNSITSLTQLPTEHYSLYIDQLTALVVDRGHQSAEWCAQADEALDGEAHSELRKAVSAKSLRLHGAYFTKPKLALLLVRLRSPKTTDRYVYLDPACGAGDLLLAAARYFPVWPSLEDTLRYWGQLLRGCDTQELFVIATKLRLTLLALRRGIQAPEIDLNTIDECLPHIRVGNALDTPNLYKDVDILLLNPPFNTVTAPKECSWAQGGVTSAALFVDYAISHLGTGSAILAILPDALRTRKPEFAWPGESSLARKQMGARFRLQDRDEEPHFPHELEIYLPHSHPKDA